MEVKLNLTGEEYHMLMRMINHEETDKSSELFAEMFNYFAAFVKTLDSADSTVKVTEQIFDLRNC